MRYLIAMKHAKRRTPNMEVGFEGRLIRYNDSLYLRIDFEM